MDQKSIFDSKKDDDGTGRITLVKVVCCQKPFCLPIS